MNVKRITAAIIGAEIVMAASFGAAGVHGLSGTAYASPGYSGPVVDQDNFPCQEDEVLGFAPQFGPDHVGCIHVDALIGSSHAHGIAAADGGVPGPVAR